MANTAVYFDDKNQLYMAAESGGTKNVYQYDARSQSFVKLDPSVATINGSDELKIGGKQYAPKHQTIGALYADYERKASDPSLSKSEKDRYHAAAEGIAEGFKKDFPEAYSQQFEFARPERADRVRGALNEALSNATGNSVMTIGALGIGLSVFGMVRNFIGANTGMNTQNVVSGGGLLSILGTVAIMGALSKIAKPVIDVAKEAYDDGVKNVLGDDGMVNKFMNLRIDSPAMQTRYGVGTP